MGMRVNSKGCVFQQTHACMVLLDNHAYPTSRTAPSTLTSPVLKRLLERTAPFFTFKGTTMPEKVLALPHGSLALTGSGS